MSCPPIVFGTRGPSRWRVVFAGVAELLCADEALRAAGTRVIATGGVPVLAVFDHVPAVPTIALGLGPGDGTGAWAGVDRLRGDLAIDIALAVPGDDEGSALDLAAALIGALFSIKPNEQWQKVVRFNQMVGSVMFHLVRAPLGFRRPKSGARMLVAEGALLVKMYVSGNAGH